jgi:hypothetical protein
MCLDYRLSRQLAITDCLFLYYEHIEIYEIDPICYLSEEKRTEIYYVNGCFPCKKS